jgi:hypothetical protein
VAETWRELRVFISSTFRDMQAERDHLVRFVFPRLREELLRRRIHLVDVDLRWGVTADQDALDLCMDEIDRCRPRFVCMLGGRYGWVPPPETVPRAFMDPLLARAGAAERQLLENVYALDEAASLYRLREKPQAKADVELWQERGNEAVEILQAAGFPGVERSITASEVLYGALDKGRLATPTFRYFYFREPAVTDSIPVEHAGDYREPDGSFAAEALDDLKERVKGAKGKVLAGPDEVVDAPVPFYEYPCRWDDVTHRIVDLRQFGARVHADLLESLIAELGPAPSERPDVFEDENAAAEAFVETRVERYVVGSRQGVFDKLFAHAEGAGDDGYLCVVAEPGSGKSALLARFYRDYEARHPDHLVIPHFIGVNATNVRELLRRLCHELAVGAGLSEELPVDFDELRTRFSELLEAAAQTRRVVLLIDAINQLDPAHGGPGMTWLPDRLPDNARVILTALESPALEALRRRARHGEETLEPLTEEDAQAIIEAFLAWYRKELDKEQRELLLAKKEADKPLYLLTALEELRTLGTYEEITNRIREIPGEVRRLFRWILERLENDDGFRDEQGNLIGETLVRAYCSALAVGRSGMTQAELVELVDAGDPQGNVAALRQLLRPYLMRRGELLDFFHDQLRQAVEDVYLDEEKEQLGTHSSLAEYFRRKADPASDGTWAGGYERGLSELPYHLAEAERLDDVYDVLTDFRFLEHKAAEVGIVEQADGTKMYTGVFQLQDDFELALAKMGGDGTAADGRRRIIVTATDLGDGLELRCPHCNQSTTFEDRWKGEEIDCPQCSGPLKVNDFVVERATLDRP